MRGEGRHRSSSRGGEELLDPDFDRLDPVSISRWVLKLDASAAMNFIRTVLVFRAEFH